ncbi:LacI family DNA-binding transcriptional regulator [Rhodococcus fascians]|uniref:Lactose operon repressor n=1 Tax=Rhodococcoides fascians TaxID=1828 RepID=A0A143QL58_RHOFA|nr:MULTISPECIES: LacI family DNA-binding transcriptional regulator [Rhodococcus]MDP9635747.1 DNA-binding LacI/PurR family transcriptional regulator [Rhodococcus cercidiphylli]OZD34371.1 LacI family transcriptional regulator [Rhodococcus sp. 06-1477-1B]RZL75250.1 MAG: LacI family DNA-binding transcriptional regulator [Rhodococcus sp. (in: high G+C Gram-positive bacteria)]AMY23790.1 Lactose operon repressor [Rhodococcus fascians]KMJ47280.1 LacI family transcriptional regulator [Rhodococcus fasci
MTPTRGPAMTDVARLAGVSHQTVSRVINGHPNVTEATRTRVEQAIAELGYRPNTAARALVTGRSSTIGIVGTGNALYGPVSTLYSVEQAARQAGYSVVVGVPTSFDEVAISTCVRRLQKQGVDGVVVIAPLSTDGGDIAELAAELPLVAVEGSPEGDLAVVSVDQVAGAQSATTHLLSLGHRAVWHVAGPSGWYEAADRVIGWRSAHEQAGVEPPLVLAGDWTAKSGFEAGCRLAENPDVTAVFAGNDAMALGVLRALEVHGRKVPTDVSVVGFDDVPDAEFFSPPLTTIRQEFSEVGIRSVEILLAQIDSGNRSTRRSRIEPSLVIRSSTAEARDAHIRS